MNRTPRSPTPLQSLIASSQPSHCVGADFRKNTVTFGLKPGQTVAAGEFMLIPAIVARLAVEQEQAERTAESKGIQLLPHDQVEARFCTISGNTALEITSRDGNFGLTLYRNQGATEGERKGAKPAHWWGITTRKDASGEEWDGPVKRYVQNDFGDLVQVAA